MAIAAALLAAVVVAATASGSVRGAAAASECSGLADRRLEVCTAYVVNATLGARVPYYRLGTSSNPARARLARYRLESRYVGAARQEIERRVAGWPRGEQDVDVPRLSIVSVRVTGDNATLVTRETWRVETEGGRVLLREIAKRHIVLLRRVPGLALHKWVVAGIGG